MALIPFDDRDGTIWLNGEMLPWRDAKTHTLSHGLHYASLVFEGERVYSGTIFKGREHTERLRNSCKICLLYTSPSPRDKRQSRMPSSA